MGCWYSKTLAATKEKILKSFQPKVMSKTEAISQKLQKQPKMSKNGHFWVIKAKKIPVFEFLQEYQYSNTLEDTKGKILGSLQPKLMSKTEVRSQNSENWLISANFLAIKAKKSQIPNFYRGTRTEAYYKALRRRFCEIFSQK